MLINQVCFYHCWKRDTRALQGKRNNYRIISFESRCRILSVVRHHKSRKSWNMSNTTQGSNTIQNHIEPVYVGVVHFLVLQLR